MKSLVKLAIGAASIASLAACGEQAATNEAAGAPQNMQADNAMAAMNEPATPFSQSEMRMHEQMMAANGTTVSETWARKMIAHHRGAIQMSEILLAEDPNSRFAEMARKTVRDQGAEIQELERMLSAGSGATEPSPTPTPSASPTPETAAKATAQPKAAEKAPAAADPHAGHDMSNMSNSM